MEKTKHANAKQTNKKKMRDLLESMSMMKRCLLRRDLSDAKSRVVAVQCKRTRVEKKHVSRSQPTSKTEWGADLPLIKPKIHSVNRIK